MKSITEPCELHELVGCQICKPSDLPDVVVVTRGAGASFHRDEHCRALADGQRRVTERGGQPASVERVTRAEALRLDRWPCLECFPEAKGKA